MKAMILAAGFGKRLQPLTLKRAKAAIPVMNVPLIVHTLLFLKRNGINDAVINLHYMPDSIKELVGDGSRFDMHIAYSYETQIMGTAGGLKKAQEFLRNSTFVMINSDTLIEFNLQDAIRYHKKNNAVATMVLTDFNEKNDYGPVEVDDKNRIKNILGKISCQSKPLEKKIFVGVHIFEADIFSFIPSDKFYEINAQVYPELIQKEKKVFGYPLKGYWNDVGTLRRYLEVHKEIFENKSILSWKFGNNEKFTTGENCQISDEKITLNYAVFGENCRVGKNSVLTEIVALKNVKIGRDVKISRSILDEGVIIDDGMVIGDSAVYMDSQGRRNIVPIPE